MAREDKPYMLRSAKRQIRGLLVRGRLDAAAKLAAGYQSDGPRDAILAEALIRLGRHMEAHRLLMSRFLLKEASGLRVRLINLLAESAQRVDPRLAKLMHECSIGEPTKQSDDVLRAFYFAGIARTGTQSPFEAVRRVSREIQRRAHEGKTIAEEDYFVHFLKTLCLLKTPSALSYQHL